MQASGPQNERGQVITSPPEHAMTVTPSDTADLPAPARIYVGVTGNVSVVTAGGETVAFAAFPAGAMLPVLVRRVRSTGTGASSLVAVF